MKWEDSPVATFNTYKLFGRLQSVLYAYHAWRFDNGLGRSPACHELTHSLGEAYIRDAFSPGRIIMGSIHAKVPLTDKESFKENTDNNLHGSICSEMYRRNCLIRNPEEHFKTIITRSRVGKAFSALKHIDYRYVDNDLINSLLELRQCFVERYEEMQDKEGIRGFINSIITTKHSPTVEEYKKYIKAINIIIEKCQRIQMAISTLKRRFTHTYWNPRHPRGWKRLMKSYEEMM